MARPQRSVWRQFVADITLEIAATVGPYITVGHTRFTAQRLAQHLCKYRVVIQTKPVVFVGIYLTVIGSDQQQTVGAGKFVFQSFHLVPSLNALENVMLPTLAFRSDAAEARDRARFSGAETAALSIAALRSTKLVAIGRVTARALHDAALDHAAVSAAPSAEAITAAALRATVPD